jgi:hypothetical protein
VGRTSNRNKQRFWYALYASTETDHSAAGYRNGLHAEYSKPVMACANISSAKGDVVARQFGDDDMYDRVIVVEDRDTPIDEYTVLWIDSVPELDKDGALAVNEDGDYLTPWDYVVRKVGRGLPTFGNAIIAVSKVNVS